MLYIFIGRYGDPVNPWGDIMAVAETWCVSSPNAKLAIAVPTSVSLGADFIPYNAHRIYGPVLYPFLVSLVSRNNFHSKPNYPKNM